MEILYTLKFGARLSQKGTIYLYENAELLNFNKIKMTCRVCESPAIRNVRFACDE